MTPGEKLQRSTRYAAALKELATEGDADAERLVRDNTPIGNIRRNLFIRGAANGAESVDRPELTARVRTRVVVNALEE